VAYEAGTAVLEVTASFKGIEDQLARGARQMAQALDKHLGGQVGKAMERAGREGEKVSERTGRKLGQVFAERAIKQVETALGNIPDSDRILKPLRQELEALSKIDLGKGFDEKDFIARVERAYTALRRAQQDAQGKNAVGRYTNAGNAAAALGSVQEIVRAARVRGFEAGDAFTNAYQARIKAMRAALPDVRVNAQSTPDERRAAALRQRIDAAQRINVGDVASSDNNPLNLKIGAKVSAADILRELATIEALLDQFTEQSGQIELTLAADKARAQAGAFYDDIKTTAEKAAEAEVASYLKAWDEARREQLRRDQKMRQDLARAHEEALAEELKRERRKADDLARMHAEALRENERRAQDMLRGTTAGRVQEGTRGAAGAIQNIPVRLQGEAAEREMAAIRKRLEALGDLEIGVTANTRDFARDVQREFDRLERLAKNRDVRIDIRTDAARAASELGGVLSTLDRLGGRKTEVKVDTDSASAGLLDLASSLSLNLGRLGALIAAGASIGTIIVPAAAAAASAIGFIGTAALGAASGLGVMILGFSGIGEAVSLMGRAAEQQQKTSGSLARAGNQVASAAAQVKSAEMALANTRRNNAQAAIKAQRAIREAVEDQRDAVRAAAREIQDATERYDDARRDANRADVDAARAQQGLSDAYREARRAIEDLNSSVRGNALDQRQAALDIAEARQELDKVTSNPRATQAEREQAAITYEQRLLQMDDLKRKSVELGEEQEKRLAAGLKGSREVKQAEEDIVTANERLLDARKALQRADQDLAEARVDAQERIADAQQKVVDAEQAAVDQRLDAAYSLFTANQAVISAQRSLQNAAVSAGTAGSAAMDNLRNKLAEMTPAGREFAAYLFGLKDAFLALKTAADPVVRGLQTAMQSLIGKTSEEAIRRMQPFFDFVGRVATALGGIFVRFANALKGPAFQRFFGYISDTAVPSLNNLYTAFENITVGFLNLFMAFTPLSGDVEGGFLAMTESFRRWSESLETNQGFQEFLNYLRTSGPQMVELFKDMAIAMGKLIVAAAPIGTAMAVAFTKFFELIDKIPQETLQALVAGIAAAAGAIAIFALATKIALLSTAGLVAGGIGLLIVALIALIGSSDSAKSALGDAWDGIKSAMSAAWAVVQPVLKQLGQLFVDLWAMALPTLRQLGDMFVWLWHNAIVPAAKGIWTVLLQLWDTVRPVFETLMVIIKAVAQVIWWLLRYVIIPVVGAIIYALVKTLTPVIKFLWKWIVQPILKSIGLAFEVLAAIVKVAVGLILIVLKSLGMFFRDLYTKYLKPAWDWMVKNIFRPMGDWFDKEIGPKWDKGFKNLAKSWDQFMRLLRTPVKFVVETLLNDGLLKGYNWLAEWFNIEPKNVRIPAPKGGWNALYASGGAVYGPGTGTSDSIPARLSNGEHVLTAAEVRAAGGHQAIYALRKMILGGALLPKFAAGGAVGWRKPGTGDGFGDWLKKTGAKIKDKATDVFTNVGSFIRDPTASLKKLFEGLIKKVPMADAPLVQKLLSIPKKGLDAVLDKVKGLIGMVAGQEGGVGVSGYGNRLGGSGGMIAILRSIFPGLSLNSGLRPGAITATGNPSLHGKNQAIDVPPRMDVFEWIRKNYPDSHELIFSPAGGRQIYRGRPHVYSGVTKAMHYDHVHWGYKFDKGGLLPDTRSMPGGVMQVFHGRRTPDKVLTDNQWNNMATLAAKARESMRGGDTFNFPYRDSTLNVQELDRFFSRRDALARVNRTNY
jgi:hypothetical protein